MTPDPDGKAPAVTVETLTPDIKSWDFDFRGDDVESAVQVWLSKIFAPHLTDGFKDRFKDGISNSALREDLSERITKEVAKIWNS